MQCTLSFYTNVGSDETDHVLGKKHHPVEVLIQNQLFSCAEGYG